jgi:hypothetical protein
MEDHIFNFPEGRAFRKQWNIAFTAGETSENDTASIELGFLLAPTENATDGVLEY